MDAVISSIYNVARNEASEIHINYHLDRILSLLLELVTANGIRQNDLAERLRNLDFLGIASQVARGKLSENAAADTLFRLISLAEAPGEPDDRYIGFYA